MSISDEQINILKQRQENRSFHPYTCIGNKMIWTKELIEEKLGPLEDFIHLLDKEFHSREFCPLTTDNGVLMPTKECWICPCGEYKQEYRL